MMRSLFSGVSGLRSHQTKMDVIGNNIANVNTLGFKKSAVNFADLYSETTSQANAPTGDNGGTNAKQIGLGVSTNAIVIKHNPGATEYTGNPLDLAIEGDGFFSVRMEDGGELFTRAGNLNLSSNGSLVTSNGHFVQCFGTMYQRGTQGILAGTSGLGDETGEGASTRGFTNFTFEPADGAIPTASSGTYTFEMAPDNMSINVLLNGLVWKENLRLRKRENGNWVDYDGEGFGPEESFMVDIEDLGTITFTTQGHGLSVNGANGGSYPATTESASGQIRNVQVNTDSFSLLSPVGTYKLAVKHEIQTDPVTGESTKRITGVDLVENLTLADARKLLGVTGTMDSSELTVLLQELDPQWQPVPEENPTSFQKVLGTYQGLPDANGELEVGRHSIPLMSAEDSSLNLGVLSFEVTGETGTRANVVDALIDLGNSLTLRVTAPSTEGSNLQAVGTAIGYLDSLMQGASVTVTNNDGFSALNSRSDLIIDPNLYENVSIGSDGSVVAECKADVEIDGIRFAKGQRVVLGYIALTTFANYEGLEKVGTNLYAMTQNSGGPVYNLAGEGGTGEIASSSLEMSNVDLSEEFVNMITTQRGFQANSRVITVSDTMLEELINLKR